MSRDLLTSSIGLTQQRISRFNQSESKLSQLISTGGSVEDYQDLKGISVANYISAEAELSTLSAQKFMATTLQQRQNYMSTKVEQARGINERIHTFLVSLGTPSIVDSSFFATQRDQLISEMTQVLNASFLGSALFSGTHTQTKAVNPASLTVLDASAPVETDYYEGGEGGMLIQVDGLRSVDKFPVTAEDSAFAKTLTALRMLKSVSDPSVSDPHVKAAIGLVNSAKDTDYPSVTFRVGEMGRRLNAVLSENMERVINAETTLSKGNPDTIETFMRLETEKMISSMSLALIVEEIKSLDELTSRF